MAGDPRSAVGDDLTDGSLIQRLYPGMTMAEIEDEFVRQLLRVSAHPDTAEAMAYLGSLRAEG